MIPPANLRRLPRESGAPVLFSKTTTRRSLRSALLALLLVFIPAAHAQLSIEITGAGAQRIPIAIVPFAGENSLPPGISNIVRADLERSGLFRGLELPPIVPPPTETTS